MSRVGSRLARMIGREGPIGVDRYMALCLEPYYGKRDPFGAEGDFITAPEISQMFGELIGLWAAEVWRMMGSPSSFRLIELGPGRGTLMADALRAGRAMPGFCEALGLHFVELSPVLRQKQAERLAASGVRPIWRANVADALDGPAIVIANEFLDALPVRQFVMTEDGWRERLVGLDGAGRFRFERAAERAAGIGEAAPVGTIFEQAEAAGEVVTRIGSHVAQAGGAALFVDYGSALAGFGDTLQAVKRHICVDVFETPGEADLTVQVDFGRLKPVAAAAGVAVHGPVTQAEFLFALGLRQRAEALLRKATPAQAEALSAQVARLTDPGKTGMGALFKAFAVADKRLPPLPGFSGRSREI